MRLDSPDRNRSRVRRVMENVVLIIHLVLALTLIGTVLLQRSEGGGLGIEGGGGGGRTGSRPAPTAMGKLTWGLALAFIATSIALTIIAANNAAGSSVVDRLIDAPAAPAQAPVSPGLDGGSLLPPTSGDAALVPQANDTPAEAAPSASEPSAPAAETPATEAPATEAPADAAPAEGSVPAPTDN